MKKYKIGNKVVYANSLHDALEVYKHKVKDAGELQYPAVSSTHPNIISSTLNHIEEELKYAKVEGDKRGKTRVFKMLSEAREYYDRYKKECDNFEKFVKEYRKYLEDQYKRIMNLDAEATNFKGW